MQKLSMYQKIALHVLLHNPDTIVYDVHMSYGWTRMYILLPDGDEWIFDYFSGHGLPNTQGGN